MHRSPSSNPDTSSLSAFSDAGSERSLGSSLSSQREWNHPSRDLPAHQLILKDLDLTGKVTQLDFYPFDSGGTTDIYRGKLNASPLLVAVKIFRRMHSEPETLEQMSRSLYEEARTWTTLRHPNILSFLGIALDLGLSPALVSPLCISGPIMKYLRHNAETAGERLKMAIGVADGLAYIHSRGISHGNLCTKKVLVNADGIPVIFGYGMSKALRQPANITSLFSSPIRFTAPECFSVETGASSVWAPAGDVYAFSMVTLEILSGLEPYHHLPTEHTVFMHILRGDRPIRTHLNQAAVTNRMWRLLTSLWSHTPSLRPNMSTVVSSLVRIWDDEGMLDEDSELSEPKAASPRNENDDETSGGEETSFEDPSHPDIQVRDLNGRVTQDGRYPFAGGGNSNIYRGKLHRSDGRRIRVAIKLIRVSDDGSGQLEDVLRRLRREVNVWSRLKHPNILPFIGVCEDLAPWPVLIAPFYKFGHVGMYLKKHPAVRGVASGLEFLHANNIIHGQLKVQNVLVDKQGKPCICDFGISKIIDRRGFTTWSVGTPPYMAPELFFVVDCTTQEELPSTTKSSDVYSFALLVLEILTSEPPKGRPSRPIVTSRILAGLRPKRDDYNVDAVQDQTWSVLDSCWSFEPQLRPSISEVLRELNASFLAEPVSTSLAKPLDLMERQNRCHPDEKSDLIEVPPETSFEDPSVPDIHGLDLKGCVTQDDLYPFAGGGNSNIYRGKLTRSDGCEIRVAIKMIRMLDDGVDADSLRRLRREVDVWSRLKHPNILPFIGVCDDLAPFPVLIAPFYEFGHVGKYLRKNPAINREEMVHGIALGLEFLHANDIIHGDVKVNVLVDEQGAPRICDFGISRIINRHGFTTSNAGTAPYMAPELFFVVDGTTHEKSPSTTKSSDVYSFALLVLEILTIEPPKGRPSIPFVTNRILAGLRPKRDDYNVHAVKNQTWSVLNRCWSFEPQLRPPIFEVLRELNASFLAEPVDPTGIA